MNDQPLSYWVTAARLGFENGLNRVFDELGITQAELARKMEVSRSYVSQMLRGQRRNLQLETMVEWARAVGAIVQISLIKEEGEAVRVVDYETAALLDDLSAGERKPAKPAVRESRFKTADNVISFVPGGSRFVDVKAETKGAANG